MKHLNYAHDKKPIKAEGQNNKAEGIDLSQKVYGYNNSSKKAKKTSKQTPFE